MNFDVIWTITRIVFMSPAIWLFLAALIAQAVLLIIFVRRPKWWRWLILLILEQATILGSLGLTFIAKQEDDLPSYLIGTYAPWVFCIMIMITLIFWIAVTCRQWDRKHGLLPPKKTD